MIEELVKPATAFSINNKVKAAVAQLHDEKLGILP
jgi:hypothetical protein